MTNHLMKKNMMDSILKKFLDGFKDEYFVRVGQKNHDFFIGRDENGFYCFEFRGDFSPVKLIGSKPLVVNQYKIDNTTNILRFSLEYDELIGCFSVFCEDLLDSVLYINEPNLQYKTLITRYSAWRKLFKVNRTLLNEIEIMGLIGELLFLKNHAIPNWGPDAALASWTGPEKTHKDFSCGNDWFEIKTISTGKETVHISSIEQLDSDVVGTLHIYSLEKMSPSFNGVNLNFLTNQILENLTNAQKDELLSKLDIFGFDFNPSYDSFVYSITDESAYNVEDAFPRLKRNSVPLQISKVQYDIIITEILPYKKPTV